MLTVVYVIKKLMKHLTLIAAFTFLVSLFAAQSAQAQLTLTVTRTDDRNTACVTGVDCSLREAINAANAAATNDTINFAIPADDPNCPAGVCTITLAGNEILFDSTTTAGTLTITNSTGANNLLISGNNASRVFHLNPGADLTINGVTITKGNRDIGTTIYERNGGGIYNNRGKLTLTNSAVSGNTASNSGGGLSIDDGGTLTLTNSTVSGNTAGSGGGGGIYIDGSNGLTLINSTVSGNMSVGNGGGISCSTSTSTMTNSKVSGNMSGGYGGGVYTFSTMTMTNSTVSDNISSYVCGGGIFNNNTLILINSVVSGNISSYGLGYGGGICSFGSTIMTNSTVSGNIAVVNGGGIYSSGALISTNSTVSYNTASNNGGIYSRANTLNLTSVTVTLNKSTSLTCTTCVGGIFNDSNSVANLKNTIIAGNTVANAASSPDFGGAVAAGSAFNLIGSGQGTTGISNGINGNQVGVDPRLDPILRLNGGTTANHALLADSPARDKGNSFDLITDQRELTRPFDDPSITNAIGGDGADIGAFEVQAGATAAAVSVGGKVTTSSGRGVFRAMITLTDSRGDTQTAFTNPFGYYRLTAAGGETYILTVSHKRFNFAPRVVNAKDDLTDVDFTEK